MSESFFEKRLLEAVPVPVCIVDSNGKVVACNSRIGEVFIYDEIVGSDFFALTGCKLEELKSYVDRGTGKIVERSDKSFQIHTSLEGPEEDPSIYVFFDDVTGYAKLRAKYEAEKTCVCIVRIDNYDELIASTPPDMRMSITSLLDKTVRKWAAENKASIVRHKENEYVFYFEHAFLKGMTDSKFAILDEVRQIETEADFPMSFSIGVGVGGENLVDTEENASAALDMALGRGGDQAVVKDENQTDYYGGKLQTVEKANKGKSRVIAHRLKQMIGEAERIYIMGHTNPDMDAFGSALGIFRVCKMNGKDATIVLNEVNESLQVIYKQAIETGKYHFVTGEQAMDWADEKTLLVIVDTHRASYLECPGLLESGAKLAIIDHHRRATDAIKGAALSYIEPYASSAAELVSEILQYAGPKRVLEKLEAEALLGGMTIDTNRFAVKTGVRTFEAAAWLRRSGADTTEVKRFFQIDMESFRVRARAIASAAIHSNGVATSICEGENREAQIIHSQVADELLNIKDVRASFVAGRNDKGKTVISARSLGEINVQVIMEKLGGGGHLTTAGAQVDMTPEEVLEYVKKAVNEKR